jgi:hypothetical protein
VKVRRAVGWRDLRPGDIIVYRGDQRKFIYRVESLVWHERCADVTHLKTKTSTRLYSLDKSIKEGKIWVKVP